MRSVFPLGSPRGLQHTLLALALGGLLLSCGPHPRTHLAGDGHTLREATARQAQTKQQDLRELLAHGGTSALDLPVPTHRTAWREGEDELEAPQLEGLRGEFIRVSRAGQLHARMRPAPPATPAFAPAHAGSLRDDGEPIFQDVSEGGSAALTGL